MNQARGSYQFPTFSIIYGLENAGGYSNKDVTDCS